MTHIGTTNKKRVVNRTLLVAEAFALCIASTSALAAIIDSGPVNIAVPYTFDGIYLNVLNGQTGTTGASVPGYDFNPFATVTATGNLSVFWCASTTACGGVGSTTAGPLLVLAPGATIGAAAIYTRAVAAASSFRVTQDAFMGFRFQNEATAIVNYGYARLTTTGPTGFPATIVSYSYDNTGAAITIPAGAASAPVFGYTPAASGTVSFTGGTTIGSTGSASIAVAVVTPGSGTGAASTTTTTCTAPIAPFSGFAQSVTAEGTGATSGGPLTGTCVLGPALVTQTLTCSENRGGASTAVTFTLSCPAGSPSADLSINKTDGQSIAEQGSTVTYTITASNAGPSATTATVTDTIPAGLEQCAWGCTGTVGTVCAAGPVNGNINDAVTLPNGSSIVYTLQCTVATAATGDIVNSATIQGAVSDPSSANNATIDTTTAVTRGIFMDGFEEPIVVGQ